MPLYHFKNIATGEDWETFISISAMEDLVQDPNIEQIIYAPAFISGVGGVTHKVDSGFNDMLSRVADANPHSPLAQVHGNKGIKESKTRRVVNKSKGLNF
jgi:hypothetical protein